MTSTKVATNGAEEVAWSSPKRRKTNGIIEPESVPRNTLQIKERQIAAPTSARCSGRNQLIRAFSARRRLEQGRWRSKDGRTRPLKKFALHDLPPICERQFFEGYLLLSMSRFVYWYFQPLLQARAFIRRNWFFVE